ncbi:hypothetical protein VNO80_21175 [Phaseolus coccineus]|uniref:Uncharacterized protein n=1 Tax=Phaseolus coccineus TaxID=3886 RepID=A0AAN9QST9_PHACN
MSQFSLKHYKLLLIIVDESYDLRSSVGGVRKRVKTDVQKPNHSLAGSHGVYLRRRQKLKTGSSSCAPTTVDRRR